jgi:hypothetical protein
VVVDEAEAKAAPRAKRGNVAAAAAEVVVDEAEAKAAPRAKRGNAVINQAAVVVHQSAGAGAHKNVRNAENAVEEPSKRARGDRFKSAEVGEESTLMLDIPTPTRDRKRKPEETKSNSIDVGSSAKKAKIGLVDREHGTPTTPAHQPKFEASKMEASSQVHSCLNHRGEDLDCSLLMSAVFLQDRKRKSTESVRRCSGLAYSLLWTRVSCCHRHSL